VGPAALQPDGGALHHALVVASVCGRCVGLGVACDQDIKDVISRVRLDVPNLDDVLEVMNQQNYILKKGRGLYALHTSTYSQAR
jgi:hypothetical protein